MFKEVRSVLLQINNTGGSHRARQPRSDDRVDDEHNSGSLEQTCTRIL